jgi:hypothetical protein
MRPFQLLFQHSCFDFSIILWLQTPDFAGANNNNSALTESGLASFHAPFLFPPNFDAKKRGKRQESRGSQERLKTGRISCKR